VLTGALVNRIDKHSRIIEANVLYHSLPGLTSPSNETQLPMGPFMDNFGFAERRLVEL
jgi:hypothetical protein